MIMGVVAERVEERRLSEIAWLVEEIVCEMVNCPEDVEVIETTGEQTTLLEVRCHPEDVKHVLGRGGRNIDALRVLLVALGGNEGREYVVRVLEPGRARGKG